MAAPTVVARTGGVSSGSQLSHPVTLPEGEPGDVWVVLFGADGTDAVSTADTGWRKLGEAKAQGTFDGVIAAFVGEVGEASSSLAVSSGVWSTQSAHNTYLISGADADSIEAAFQGSGSGSPGDPPNLSPSGGSKDYLWIAGTVVVAAFDDFFPTGAPANYSNLLQHRSQVSAVGGNISSAERTRTASSENPGAFAGPASSWAAVTIAVPPKTSLTITLGAISESGSLSALTGRARGTLGSLVTEAGTAHALAG